MRFFLIIILLLINFTSGFSQKNISFEGIITLKKETVFDTSFYNYYIKGTKIRIDYVEKTGKLIKYKIIDFARSEFVVVNPYKKLYVLGYINSGKPTKDSGIEIEKTGNYKYIENRLCYQWIVKDKAKNAVVTYWVTKNGYKYYSQMLKVLDETDKISAYYIQIPQTEGYFPLLSEERSWLRDERMRLKAEKIMQISVDDNLFEVPRGYTLFN